MNKFVLSAAILFSGIVGTISQTPQMPSPTSPPDPQVSPIPEAVRWELVTSLEQKAPAADAPAPANPNQLKRVEIARTGRIQRVVVEFAKSGIQTTWVADNQMFVEANNLVSSGKVSTSIPQFYSVSSHYYGTDWVTASKFQKRILWNQREVDYYETDEPSDTEKSALRMAGKGAEATKIYRRAYIEATTRLPAAVVAPEGTFFYRFLQPPTSPLQLPDVFAQKQREREAEVKRQQAEASLR